MDPWLKFVDRWRECTACHLCESREKVVLARGNLPCDVLFVGEAPGESEDSLGAPFVGPAGQLLDRIIDQANLAGTMVGVEDASGYRGFCRWALTNLVCCIPRDEYGGKATEPDDESIKACSIRLIEFVKLADPKLIVCVGKLAFDWLEPGYKYSIKLHRRIPLLDIHHPAYILRANVAQQGLLAQRCVVKLRNAVKDL